MKTLFFLLTLTIAQIASACCSGISADIRYEMVAVNTFRFTVVAYTCLSIPNDLPEIEVTIDQSIGLTVPRTSIMDDPSVDQRRSEYSFDQVFIGNGIHSVDAFVGWRGAGMVNIPSSISEWVCIRAEVLVDPVITSNTSIAFATHPTQIDQVWNAFVHTPSPSDPDGDSLAFELGIPRGQQCTTILGYQPPIAVNFTWLNPENGTFIWDYPVAIGTWNLTISGAEYRNGQFIGQVTRDMTICVFPFPVDIEEATSVGSFRIIPSLANDRIFIDAPGIWRAEILDGAGRIVLQQEGLVHASPVDITLLPNGTYQLRATSASGSVRIARFVKVE